MKRAIATLLLAAAGCGSLSNPCTDAGYSQQEIDLARQAVIYARDEGVPYSFALEVAYESAYTYEEADCFLWLVQEAY
jgi:hypothetical protein